LKENVDMALVWAILCDEKQFMKKGKRSINSITLQAKKFLMSKKGEQR